MLFRAGTEVALKEMKKVAPFIRNQLFNFSKCTFSSLKFLNPHKENSAHDLTWFDMTI